MLCYTMIDALYMLSCEEFEKGLVTDDAEASSAWAVSSNVRYHQDRPQNDLQPHH